MEEKKLRFDGVYVRKEGQFYDCLRFYPEGVLLRDTPPIPTSEVAFTREYFKNYLDLELVGELRKVNGVVIWLREQSYFYDENGTLNLNTKLFRITGDCVMRAEFVDDNILLTLTKIEPLEESPRKQRRMKRRGKEPEPVLKEEKKIPEPYIFHQFLD